MPNGRLVFAEAIVIASNRLLNAPLFKQKEQFAWVYLSYLYVFFVCVFASVSFTRQGFFVNLSTLAIDSVRSC